MPRVLLSRGRLVGGIVTGVLALDAGSKLWAIKALHRTFNSGGLVSLEHSSNSGLSFSGLNGQSWLVMILSVGVLLGLSIVVRRAADTFSCVAISLVLGGGLSNLIDRLLHGGRVTDFLGVLNWFVCNGADLAISVGVGLVIVQVCMGRKVLR